MYSQRPLWTFWRVDHVETLEKLKRIKIRIISSFSKSDHLVCGESDEAVGEDPIVWQSDPRDCLVLHIVHLHEQNESESESESEIMKIPCRRAWQWLRRGRWCLAGGGRQAREGGRDPPGFSSLLSSSSWSWIFASFSGQGGWEHLVSSASGPE